MIEEPPVKIGDHLEKTNEERCDVDLASNFLVFAISVQFETDSFVVAQKHAFQEDVGR